MKKGTFRKEGSFFASFGEKSAMVGSFLLAAVGVDDGDAVDGKIIDENER